MSILGWGLFLIIVGIALTTAALAGPVAVGLALVGVALAALGLLLEVTGMPSRRERRAGRSQNP